MIEDKILIKTPYNINNQKQAKKILNDDILQKIKSKEERVVLNDICTLTKRTLEKPLHLLKCRRLRHKVTREIVDIVQEDQLFTTIYDYIQLGDFQIKKDQMQNHELIGALEERVSKKSLNQKEWSQNQDIQKGKKDLIEEKEDQLQNQINNNIKSYESLNPQRNINNLKGQQKLKKIIIPKLLRTHNLVPPIRDQLTNYKIKQPNLNTIYQSINFGQQIPTCPLSQIPQSMKQSSLFKKLQQYLKNRPCWLRNTLLTQLKLQNFHKLTEYELKNVLRYLCYTYRNGPWKNIYCLLGYNPSQDCKSVIYQNISLKLKKKQAQDYEEQINEEIYDPTFTDLSKRCLRAYQLCDIADNQIKQILHQRLILEGNICTKQYGWLSKNQYEKIMNIMRTKLLSMDQ